MPEPTSLHTDSLQTLTTSIADTLTSLVDSVSAPVTEFAGYAGNSIPETVGSNIFVPILLLLMVFSYGYVITKGKKIILETINDFFYLKERSSIFIESGSSQVKLNSNLVFLFVCSLGLFLHTISYDAHLAISFENKGLNLLFFVGIAAVFLIIKWLAFQFLNYIFFGSGANDIFIRSYFTIMFGYALALFPIVIFLIYGPNNFHNFSLILSLIISIIAVLLIFLKTSQIFLQNIVSFFYIILYLCTLEILPIFIVLKALI